MQWKLEYPFIMIEILAPCKMLNDAMKKVLLYKTEHNRTIGNRLINNTLTRYNNDCGRLPIEQNK